MNPIEYLLSLGLTPSDWVMLALGVPLGWFFIRYGLMTKWWVDILGWGVFLMALAFTAVWVLIVYGTLAGQRVDEIWRFLIMVGLFVAWTIKDVALEHERYIGRLERRRLREHPRHTGPTPITKEHS